MTNAYFPLFAKADTDFPISVRVRNLGSTPLITFRVDWRWNNGAVNQGFSQTTTGISGGQYWPYEHPVPFNAAQGRGELKVWVVGNNETNPANDTLTFRITTLNDWATKTMLLDQWTGTWCTQCPPANTVGNQLDPDPQVIVAKHHAVDEFSSGSSTAYFEAYDVNFTPAGVIDQGEYGTYAPNPGYAQWTEQMTQRKQGVSPVALELGTDYDALTRMLTVHLGANYTFALPGEHALNAFVVEDGISAPQANAPANYVHQQIVRNVLGGPLGDASVIPNSPVVGNTYYVSWNFIVPEDWVADNIRVIGFVTHRENGEVSTLNARASGALAVGLQEQEPFAAELNVFPNPATNVLWVDVAQGGVTAEVRLLAADGRAVLEQRLVIGAGPQPLIGFGDLAPGVYHLHVLSGNTSGVRRIVKE